MTLEANAAPATDTPQTPEVSANQRPTLTLDQGAALLARRGTATATLPTTAANQSPTAPTVGGEPADGGQDNPNERADNSLLDPGTAEQAGDATQEAQEAPQAPAPDAIAFIGDDGKPVTSEEAKKGHMRRDDYSRKTAETAEVRKGLEAHEGLVSQAAQLAASALPVIDQLLKGTYKPIPPAPPEALRLSDPVDYWDQMNAHEHALKELERVRSAAQALAATDAETQQRRRDEWLASEREALSTALPEWKNPETAKREKAEIRQYAKERGISEADLRGASHQVILALRDAVVGSKVRKGGGARPKTPTPPPSVGPEARPAGSLTGLQPGGAGNQASVGERIRSTHSRADRLALGAQLLARRGAAGRT